MVVDPVGNPMNATSLPLGEGMQSPVLDMPTGGATSAKAALLIAAFDAFKSHPMGLVGASCSPRSQPASGLQGFIAALQSRQGAAVHRRAARRLTQLTEHRQRCSWLVTGPHSRRPRAGFVCALSVWTMLALPVTPLEVCAGCVFGPVWGTLGSLCGKTVGCMLALTVGRVLGKAQGWQVRARPAPPRAARRAPALSVPQPHRTAAARATRLRQAATARPPRPVPPSSPPVVA